MLDKRWAWWISGMYLISLVPTKILTLMISIKNEYAISSIMDESGVVRFDFISDRILSDVYLIVIVLFLIALLFHNNVYCNLQINCLNKKRNLIIVSALGLGFIVINDVISILMILCIRSAFLLGL